MNITIANDFREIIESGRKRTPMIGNVDVVVVGGGPAGIAASIAASRHSASTILVERYPCLGGMATGGLVLLFIEYDRYEYGIMKETAERLTKLDHGIVFPARRKRLREEERWIEGQGITGAYSPPFDPEMLKYISNEMVLEAGVKPALNCLFLDAITENDSVKGVIIENKEGRQAILAKVTIDATGDGDVFAKAGAPYSTDIHPWGTSLSFRLANVNVDKAKAFMGQRPELSDEYKELMTKLTRIVKSRMVWFPTTIPNVTLFFAWNLNLNALRVNDLVSTEIEGRRKVMKTIEFFQQHNPGFESSYLQDTASQIGTRESRRVEGHYTLTKQDILQGSGSLMQLFETSLTFPIGVYYPKN
jgi:hypothetical protein